MDNFVEITIDYDVYDMNGKFLRKDFEIFNVPRGSNTFNRHVKNTVAKDYGHKMHHEYWVAYRITVDGI